MEQSLARASINLTESSSNKCSARERSLLDILTKIAAAGIPVQQCSAHHLKYGSLNFYPKRGIVHRDGAEAAYKDRGVEFFISLCVAEMLGNLTAQIAD